MRATIDRVTGQVSMYRLTTIALSAVLAVGLLLGSLGVIGVNPYGLLATLAVVVVATLGANEAAARLARVVPHRESSVITALIIACLVPPTVATLDLVGAAVAGIVAALSKYLIVWRGRHILNPAATGVLVAGLLQLTVGIWWIATPAMLPVVALGALLLLDRTRRLDIGLILIVVTVAIIGTRIAGTGPSALDAYGSVLLLFPVVFLAGYMLSEPLTLPPRRWQQWLVAVVTALLFSIPFQFGPLYTSPELALVAANIVGFAVSRRGGFSLRLTGSRALSDSATEFTFAPSRPVPFEPGQYLELHLPHRADRRGTRRIFSIASAPEHDQISLGMRTPTDGSSFKRVLRELDEGATVQATQISGDFLLPRDPATPVVMVAGGIGVTPFASQLASAAARGESRDVHVVYVPSHPGEVLYRDVLESAGATVTVLDDTPVTADALLTAVPDLASRRAYVSGAPSLVADAATALRRAGARRVRTDYFAGY
ncbi:ferredoxin-NADP reductase [Microcella alkaliphila]|uniref:Ferredoxin-NADP reductase n=1 Tax=Microcella alkaliphila TaxID=279828 RepID=A0A4Q7TD70_9MICO|nr:FAD-dependent oxidoreductase [Microcella alkaliphila]RZT58331.1 ferredoxin-NADP reductase [Microcella alkaliphila]